MAPKFQPAATNSNCRLPPIRLDFGRRWSAGLIIPAMFR
jgi:hypothetical protein